MVRPELNRRRPAFWRLAVFLWGTEVDFDSDGNATNPDDMEWTELTLSNRIEINQRVDIAPIKTDPLILKVVGTTQPLTARAAYFLTAKASGKVSESGKIVWRSPRMLKNQMGDFDLQEAMVHVTRYVKLQEANQPAYVLAHKHSSYHRVELKNSEVCGCFYCLHIFKPTEIKWYCWTDKWDGTNQTALCPKCGIDSVIGSASGYPITHEFLQSMKTGGFS